MIEIIVRYFGPVREKTAVDEEKISVVEGSQLKRLIQLLVERHGFGTDQLAQCLIVINGRGASQLSGLETELRNGDVVCFMPQLSGG